MSSEISLVIALHGVGSSRSDIKPLADALGNQTGLRSVAPDAPFRFDAGGHGLQWFSISGVSEDNRPGRIADAMPSFRSCIEGMAAKHEVPLGKVALVGFSQGGIMALHGAADGLEVGAVIALSARLAAPVSKQSRWPKVHLLHGSEDPVISSNYATQTRDWIAAAGGSAELQLFSGLGHQMDERVVDAVVGILSASSK